MVRVVRRRKCTHCEQRGQPIVIQSLLGGSGLGSGGAGRLGGRRAGRLGSRRSGGLAAGRGSVVLNQGEKWVKRLVKL